MRSLTFVKAGKLEWRELPEPKLRGPGEALVRPIAASTCDSDRLVVQGRSPLTGPYALGHEAIAAVIDVGDQVTGVDVGDTVIVPWEVHCGECDRCRAGLTAHCRTSDTPPNYGFPVGEDFGGLFDDVVRVPRADVQLVKIPQGDGRLDPLELVPAADTLGVAISVVGAHSAADRILVLGWAGGSLHIVQVAKAYGISDITYVDSDPGNRDLAEAFGATVVAERPSPDLGTFEIVIDNSDHADWPGLVINNFMLEPEGLIECVGHFGDITLPGWMSYGLGVSFHTGITGVRPYVEEAIRLVGTGAVKPSRIWSDRVAWDDLPEAIPDQGRKLIAVRAEL